MPPTFTGFPADAFEFYADLEDENSKEFWAGNKHRYDRGVREPMVALLDDLAEEFGPGRMFRPYRDVRFSADKSPYKEHQGGYVEIGPACGYYVQVSSGGLMIGAGWYASTPEQVARFRGTVGEAAGAEDLRAVLSEMEAVGLEVGGDQVRTRPRGVPADHPALDLLRHRTLLVSRSTPHEEPWLGTPAAGERVREGWRQARPLVEWLADNVTGRTEQ